MILKIDQEDLNKLREQLKAMREANPNPNPNITLNITPFKF